MNEPTSIYRATTLAITIARPPRDVYAFVRDPQNLPRWAEGLGGGVREEGERLVVVTPAGSATLRFADDNALGVLDHVVTTPEGTEVHVPMRVVPNGDGSELLFTFFQLPGMTDESFGADAAAVERDLGRLKAILEHG
jgi:uncharacterized protein YndB with AHSA1/START domain